MTGFSIDVEALRAAQIHGSSGEGSSSTAAAAIESSLAPQSDQAKTEKNGNSGWILLCQAIDRILFISYLAIILIFIASYLGGAALALSAPPASSE